MTGVRVSRMLSIPGIKNKQKILSGLLLWGMLCITLSLGFANVQKIGTLYRAASLRYNAPISGKAALEARRYSIEQEDEHIFWPTFWRTYSTSFTSELFKANAECIAYSGNAFLVWTAEYLSGSAPGITDDKGCVVSTALAWKLWGSSDVVGKIVEVDGAERIVRGVFEDERGLALLPYKDEDTSQNWSAVELEGGSKYATRDDARSFAVASKLGNPDSIVMSGGIVFIAKALAMLPLVFLIIYVIIAIIYFLRKRNSIMFKMVLFASFVVFAIFLPVMLDALPPWLIPTRWSDFSFWSSLMLQARESVTEFLELVPEARDVEVKILLLRQTGIAFAAACCALAACARWHMLFCKQDSAME